MAPKYALCSIAAVAVVSTHASAAILVFTNEFLYDSNTTSYAAASENFDSYGGSYPSGLSGSAGPIGWSAASTGGVSVNAGRLSGAGTSPLTISFGGGNNVYGVGGNFFGTDASNTVVASLVLVTLNDGTSYLNLIDTATVFVGFVSTGASISSCWVLRASLVRAVAADGGGCRFIASWKPRRKAGFSFLRGDVLSPLMMRMRRYIVCGVGEGTGRLVQLRVVGGSRFGD
jgi:hypothetical protein